MCYGEGPIQLSPGLKRLKAPLDVLKKFSCSRCKEDYMDVSDEVPIYELRQKMKFPVCPACKALVDGASLRRLARELNPGIPDEVIDRAVDKNIASYCQSGCRSHG